MVGLTLGCDCQDDRLEAVVVGWSRSGGCYLLCHEVVHGPIADGDTWAQLDSLLRSRWPHPRGGQLRIAAACIDGSDGGHLSHVLDFARPRSARRVMAIKAVSGFARRPIEASKSKMKGGGRLWIVGSDSIKSRIFDQLARGTTIKFSDTLSPVFYEQLASERVVVRQVGGKPVRRFERIKGMAAECLDALVYAWAARARLGLNTAALDQLEEELRSPPEPAAPVTPPPAPARRDPWLNPGRSYPWGDDRLLTEGWLDLGDRDWF